MAGGFPCVEGRRVSREIKRKKWPETALLRVWTRFAGRCHICDGKIDGGREAWEADHVKPLWDGGEDKEENLAPAHVKCHRAKTREEATERAKGDRMNRRNVGIKKTVTRPLPGSRSSGWKKTFNGWEPR